jgi:chemotaxis regulatin CheY-phosphate phosphatase CheZ
MSDAATLSDEEYRQLEAFIARTPRGRAFLNEHAVRARNIAADEVKAIVQSLRTAWFEHEEAAETTRRLEVLRRELQDMSASIVQARKEIASIRPRDEGDDRISTAANELDAIVQSTERASIEILGAAERIMDAANGVRGAGAPATFCDILDAEVMNIFTACSFQDLTGQRTTKVVNALRYIEQRVLALIGLWGVGDVADKDIPAGPVDYRPDAHLLNGPSDDGVGQDDIDRMMSGESFTPASKPAAEKKEKPAKPAPPPVAEPEEPVVPLNQNSIDALFD